VRTGNGRLVVITVGAHNSSPEGSNSQCRDDHDGLTATFCLFYDHARKRRLGGEKIKSKMDREENGKELNYGLDERYTCAARQTRPTELA